MSGLSTERARSSEHHYAGFLFPALGMRFFSRRPLSSCRFQENRRPYSSGKGWKRLLPRCMTESRGRKYENDSEAPEGLFTTDRITSIVQDVVKVLEQGKEAGQATLEKMRGIGVVEAEDRMKSASSLSSSGNPVKESSEKRKTQDAGLKGSTLARLRREGFRINSEFEKNNEKGLTSKEALSAAANVIIQYLSPAMRERIGRTNLEETVLKPSTDFQQPQSETEPLSETLLRDKEAKLVETVTATLESLGVSPTDILDNANKIAERVLGIDDGSTVESANPPMSPPFDSSMAVALAGYAFRAYDHPPAGCFWEELRSKVKGSEVSGRVTQEVRTQFAYPKVELIAERFVGLYSITLGIDGDSDDVVSELQKCFLVTTLNGVMHRDVLTRSEVHMLRQTASPSEQRSAEVLDLSFYESEKAYEGGFAPLGNSRVLLSNVERSWAKDNSWGSTTILVPISPASEEDYATNFFNFDLLPTDISVPAQRKMSTLADQIPALETLGAKLVRKKLRMRITYRDLTKGRNKNVLGYASPGDEETSDKLRDAKKEDPKVKLEEATSFLEGQLRTALPKAEDWIRLVEAAKSIIKKNPKFLKDFQNPALNEVLEPALFVRSVDTSTEVWFFRDQSSKNVVASFRGTDQVEWRDFFTDALAFTQRWEPGENIDLEFLESDENEDNIQDVGKGSKVHYGFLRAYFSVRAAIERALSLLTDNFDSQHHVYFTGHSLGGALATVAALDMKKRRGGEFVCSLVSFGAPKTGNLQFAREFNEQVKNAFRVVNDSDLVTRFPKGQYRHVGRTVLINAKGEIWIEGEDESGMDPFRERYADIDELIREEKLMWASLLNGTSLEHHMETSYFDAMKMAIIAAK